MVYFECEHIVYFIELTIPFEKAMIEDAFERKKLKTVPSLSLPVPQS